MDNQTLNKEKIEVKDEIINLNIVYFQEEDLEILLEKKEFTDLVIQESYKRVKKALEEKLDKITLFKIPNLMLSIEVESSNYLSVINNALNHYTTEEKYEMCIEIQQLIKKYKL
jgi:hypothetical protein